MLQQLRNRFRYWPYAIGCRSAHLSPSFKDRCNREMSPFLDLARTRSFRSLHRLLGKSGLRVSEAALGTITFGKDRGWGSPKDEAQSLRDLSARQVETSFDTTNLYTNGMSERLLGELSTLSGAGQRTGNAAYRLRFAWSLRDLARHSFGRVIKLKVRSNRVAVRGNTYATERSHQHPIINRARTKEPRNVAPSPAAK
jgi:hypothetical protein